MNETEFQALVMAARNARDNAYAKYSGYRVGAALYVETEEQDMTMYEVVSGCNIENCNYTNTTHAEQVAVANAISSGFDPENFVALAISTDAQDGGAPCGLCQQTLAEFVGDDFPIGIDCGGETAEDFRQVTLDEAELFRADI